MSERYAARTGWRASEDELLFAQIEEGRARSLPLKAVFKRVAELTGRKPNSVRNYYYARVKERPELAAAVGAFVPFKPEEIRELMRHVLFEQAKGRSVRSITLDMGGGDTRAMLRYQNKYRSVLKNDPALVQEVLAELEAGGMHAFDPYALRQGRAGRPRGSGVASAAGGAAAELEQLDGVDASAFFEGIRVLAAAANRGAGPAVLHRLQEQQAELEAQRGRMDALLAMYRQLLAVNKEFLSLNGSYAGSEGLAHCVEACEQALME